MIYTRESFVISFFTRKVSSVFLLKEVKPSPEHNMIKLQTVEVVSVTAAFLLKLVVELRRLPRFPAQNDPASRA